jgi:hypothetical protein
MLDGRVVQQTVGIPMGTNYVPLLADFSFIRMNKMITNDHGYVPLVVNTSRSFPHSWLIIGFVIIFQSTRVHPLFLVGFVLLDL